MRPCLLRAPTAKGQLLIGDFVTVAPTAKTGRIKRSDSRRVITIKTALFRGSLARSYVKYSMFKRKSDYTKSIFVICTFRETVDSQGVVFSIYLATHSAVGGQFCPVFFLGGA